MRILAVRGENLASLAAPFEVDLAAEPLASTGLFAITGETGAGKSTILDALCLALYGEYPRVSVGRRENVPDPSGEAISIHDGRAILRRGAGSGYAEVDFVGQDGECYRVRWEANRARGRANGRLQNEQRALYRLDDGSTVAAGKTQVRDAVEARTDLTFDQFRRTVLLAQGDFDAFLLAAESERAELLEKITGTEIYATISVRVHDGTETRRRVVERLEQRRSDIGLLADGAREAVLAGQSQLASAIAEKVAERDQHGERLNHFKRVAAARSDLVQAEIQAARARETLEEAADEIQSLTEFDLVDPIRPLWADLESTQRTAAEVKSRCDDLLLARDDARILDDVAASQLSDSTAADEAAEDIFKSYGPLWSKAEKLDAELAAAQIEFGDAVERAGLAQTTLQSNVDALTVLDNELDQARGLLSATTAKLDDQSDRIILADRLGEAIELVRKRSAIKQSHATVASEAVESEQLAVSLEAEMAESSESLVLDRGRKDSLVRNIAERRGKLSAINEPALRERDTDLRRALEILREVSATCSQYIRASADLARGESELASAVQEIGMASNEIAEAEADQCRQQTARAEILPLAELAVESVSPQAIHLRSLLIPNSACPVCGSTDHPHLGHPNAVNDLVATLRRRREELDGALENTRQRLEAATRTLAAAEARQAETNRGLDAVRGQMSVALRTYLEERLVLSGLLSHAGLNGEVPVAPDGQAASKLMELISVIQTQRDAIAGPIGDAQNLRSELDSLRQEHDALAEVVDSTIKNIDLRRSELHAAQLKITENTVRKIAIVDNLASIDCEIAPFLMAAGLAVDLVDTDPAGVTNKLSAVAREYDALRKQAVDLGETLQRLLPDRAAAAASVEHAQAQASETTGRLNNRRLLVDEKTSERARLLGGEATASHRTRINEDRKTAREALAKAREVKSVSAAAFQSAVARLEEAASALEAAQSRQSGAEVALDVACLGIARSVDQVSALLGADPAVYQVLRMRIQEIERAVRDADTAILTRQNDLRRALDAFDETTDAEALVLAIATLEVEIGELQKKTGALSAALEKDDEARRAAAGLSVEIDAAKAELAVWQAVDDAVGSASGDRFRRFVQSVTLDHMVQLANEHLHALSPRYGLTRGSASDLTLHVVDRDMGDEVRGTRSLSGGERFLVSLALALALSGLEGRSSFVDTLFIDEGFGSLDAETLDLAVDALETLQSRGQKVGIITHVPAMIERIAVQIRVEKRGAGRSEIRISDQIGTLVSDVGSPAVALS